MCYCIIIRTCTCDKETYHFSSTFLPLSRSLLFISALHWFTRKTLTYNVDARINLIEILMISDLKLKALYTWGPSRSWSLLNCVPCVLKTCSRANVPCVLTCSRTNMPCVLTCLACSHANVPCVLTCSCVNLSCLLTCSRANVPFVLTCSRANGSCVLVPTYLAC